METITTFREAQECVMAYTGNRCWLFIRLLAAMILLVAAGLKTHQLLTVPLLGEGLLYARWFNVLVVESELLLGIWLVFGVLPRVIWLATVGCFSMFAVVSLYKALAGETSCGCFGSVTVNPWYTTGLDLFMVILLIRCRPKRFIVGSKIDWCKVCIATGIWFLASAPFIYGVFQYEMKMINADGVIVGYGNEIILEPNRWKDKYFPVMDYVNANELPTQGIWLVLLYTHTCSACRECVEQYAKLASEFSTGEGCPKIAIIEVPPFENTTEKHGNNVSYGQLDGRKKWKVKTPVSMLVDNGKVQTVFANPLDVALIRSIWGAERL